MKVISLKFYQNLYELCGVRTNAYTLSLTFQSLVITSLLSSVDSVLFVFSWGDLSLLSSYKPHCRVHESVHVSLCVVTIFLHKPTNKARENNRVRMFLK